jgi:nucleoside-diphosphate-sugar epimerase
MARALLTGASGFVGHHLAARLLAEGWEVHAVVRAGSSTDRLRGLPRPPVLHVHAGTTAGMLSIFERAQPQSVFHLAAAFTPDHEPADVEVLIRSNVLFGAQVLEAAARNGVQRFVNAGTFSQYHDGSGRFDPVNLYAATKQAFQDLLAYYAATGKVRSLTLVLYDTYGPDDPRPKVLQRLGEALQSGQPLDLSPGEQLMHLVHVDDVVGACLLAERLLAEQPERVAEGAYAVRSPAPMSLRAIVALYEELAGRTLPVRWGGRPYRPREVMAPWSGPPLPGWQPAISLRQGLARLLAGEARATGTGG